MQPPTNRGIPIYFICQCPQYKQQRQVLMQNVKNIYHKHNILALNEIKDKNDDRKRKVWPFNNDSHNPSYLKQFIFPPLDKDNLMRQMISYI